MSELFIQEHPDLVSETCNRFMFTAQNHNKCGIKDKLQNKHEIEINS